MLGHQLSHTGVEFIGCFPLSLHHSAVRPWCIVLALKLGAPHLFSSAQWPCSLGNNLLTSLFILQPCVIFGIILQSIVRIQEYNKEYWKALKGCISKARMPRRCLGPCREVKLRKGQSTTCSLQKLPEDWGTRTDSLIYALWSLLWKSSCIFLLMTRQISMAVILKTRQYPLSLTLFWSLFCFSPLFFPFCETFQFICLVDKVVETHVI